MKKIEYAQDTDLVTVITFQKNSHDCPLCTNIDNHNSNDNANNK